MCIGASQVELVLNNLPVSGGEATDTGSIPGSGRSPGEGSGDSLQYSCLRNPMDRGAWKVQSMGSLGIQSMGSQRVGGMEKLVDWFYFYINVTFPRNLKNKN